MRSRTPVWNRPHKLASFVTGHSLTFVLLAILLFVYWIGKVLAWNLYWMPLPGIAICLLGAVAALMTLRKNIERRETFLWIVLVFSLMVVELLAISHDRRGQDEKHEKEIAKIYGNFDSMFEKQDDLRVRVDRQETFKNEYRAAVRERERHIGTTPTPSKPDASVGLLRRMIENIAKDLRETAGKQNNETDVFDIPPRGILNESDKERIRNENMVQQLRIYAQYLPVWRTILADVPYLREETLRRLPPNSETDKDRADYEYIESVMKKDFTGYFSGNRGAIYLDGLAQKLQ